MGAVGTTYKMLYTDELNLGVNVSDPVAQLDVLDNVKI